MKIGIDAHMVGSRETGNETYVVQLSRALSEISPDRVYALATDSPAAAALADSAPRLYVRQVLPHSSLKRLLLALPAQVRSLGLDVLHASYVAPPASPSPVVLSVHDISFRVHPEAFSVRDRLLLETMIPFSIRRAARVVTLSECSRRDIIRAYHVPPEKVVVTPLAAAHRFRPTSPDEQLTLQRRLGITSPYILSVGTLQPRKNLVRLVQAFAIRAREHPSPLQLVIAGPDKYKAGALRQEIDAAGVTDQVRLLGYVPDDDLVPLYGGALAFVYPSLYEGFGLPVLEAMACGAPVVCSNTSSLPEVAGDAALLVSPHDTQAIACAIARLADDAHFRSVQHYRALDNAARFSWRRTAELTMNVYRDVIENRRDPDQGRSS